MFKVRLFVLIFLLSAVYSQARALPQVAEEDALISEAALLLSRYVQIPSVSGEEKQAGEFFANFCREKGLHVHVFTDADDSYNFAASLYPLESGKPNIVLLNHIDVVPTGEEEGWLHPPFSGHIADGYVWGRGSIDNKAMGVMQLMALIEFMERAAREDLPYNVSLLAVSGEETGGDTGARIIANEFLDVLNPMVVYGEGGAGLTGIITADPDRPVFGIGVAQKKVFWMAIESSVGSSGHGSVPLNQYPTKEVIGATSALLDARRKIVVTPTVRESLQIVSEYENFLLRKVFQRIDFYAPSFGRFIRRDPLIAPMFTNTISLTSLTSSAGAYNQIPGHARAVFDCRLLPGTDENEFLAQVKKIVSPFEVEVNVIRASPSTPTSEQGPFYHAMKSSIEDVFGEDVVSVPFLFVAVNDNRFFRRQGIPSYGILPVMMTEELMESIHSYNERFSLESLDQGIAVYVSLIQRLLNQNH